MGVLSGVWYNELLELQRKVGVEIEKNNVTECNARPILHAELLFGFDLMYQHIDTITYL